MKMGISNVISMLHRGPGIARATHPEIYDACLTHLDGVQRHLAVEGMRLLHEPVQGLFAAACRDRDEIAEECEAQGVEPFLPIANGSALDYHTSLLAVILRQRRLGMESSEDGWADLDELVDSFETYLPPAEHGDEVRIRDKVGSCLKLLMTLNFAEIGLTPEGKEGIRATGWLILRMSHDELERFTNELTHATPFEMPNEGEDLDDETYDIEEFGDE